MYARSILVLLLSISSLFAECKGRIDIGPAYVHVDMLESGHTRRRLDLYAIRGDATLLIYKGFCLKPSFMVADGHANLNAASLGFGFCIPVCDELTLTPSWGVSETHFESRIDFPAFGLFRLKEKFVSRGQFVCLDACWTFMEKWRVYGSYQYAWSRVHSQVKPLFKSKNDSKGPNYSVAIERDINDSFSISLAGGYNLSLSKEKHGLKGKGIKLGLVYWY